MQNFILKSEQKFDVTKDVNSCTYCCLCQMRDSNCIIRVNALAKNSVTQLGLPDKGRAIKGLGFCCIVWFRSMKEMGLKTCERCAGLVPYCGQDGYPAQVQQHPIET